MFIVLPMKKVSSQLTNLVFFGPVVSFNSIPNVGEFSHRNIKRIVPCEVIKGKYYDLRSHKEVKKEGNVQEWPLLKGSVLRYADKRQFLISRLIAEQENILIEIPADGFHPESMVRLPVEFKTS